MSILNNSLLLGADAGGGGYAIERSVRFNSADSAFLSRTPASAGNRKTWSWAAWMKLGSVGTGNFVLFNAENGTSTGFANNLWLYLTSNQLYVGDGVSDYLASNNKFRDPSAWYHVVLSVDTTQATASSKMKLYVNGAEITYAIDNRTSISTNADTTVNSTFTHYIGRAGLNLGYFDGYFADVFLIDGQALDPTSFGEFDDNGIWQPIAYSGSFGTNGFHLPFSNNSTAAALGTDTSGNSNTWTVNNISVASGAGNDSVVDVPTNGTETDTGVGGEVRGNYCTLNPLNISLNASLSNGNLQSVSGGVGGVNGTIFVSSGKWYWETTLDASTGFAITGIGEVSSIYYPGYSANSYAYYTSGVKYNNDTSSSYGASWGLGDIIGVALDLDAGTLTFYKNGVSQGTAFSSLSGTFAPRVGNGASSTSVTWTLNAGQRPFAYTAPSGFKALNTANLPEGAITTSGTFTGNANADGPFVYLNGIPTAMTINGNAVTFATHADKLSNGFKLRTSSTAYNTSGSNTYSITTTGDKFKFARAQPNP